MAQDGLLTPFGLADAKISPLTADTAATLTYGTAYDVPGIQSISFNPDFLDKELRGDDMILDQYTKLESISGTVKHAKVSFSVLDTIMGGTVSDSGSTPNEKRTYELLGTDTLGYWKIEGQVAYKGGESTGGDFHITFHKAKITKFQQEYTSEDYAQISFDFKAIATTYNSKIFTAEENETAVSISAGSADTTAPTCTVAPTDGAVGQATSVNVVWTFSEALQASTVHNGTVMLIKDDGTNVAGTVTLVNNGASTTVTFDPTSALSGSSNYIGILTTGVRDTAGNAIAAPSVTNFATT